MKFEESETLQCLINAFAGESQARNRYTFYAKHAKKEGYEKIAQVFLDTAENEKQHAKLFYKHIPNNHWHVSASYPFSLGNTLENLIESANAEREEWENVYKYGAEVAKADGFDEISELFLGVLEIEKRHSHRFNQLAEELQYGSFFKKQEQTQWLCRKCGHVKIQQEAPCICPVCEHPQGYFEIFCEKF